MIQGSGICVTKDLIFMSLGFWKQKTKMLRLKKDGETEKELKKIMAKNFPDFSKDINVKVQVQ